MSLAMKEHADLVGPALDGVDADQASTAALLGQIRWLIPPERFGELANTWRSSCDLEYQPTYS
jgi:hypothetical protein